MKKLCTIALSGLTLPLLLAGVLATPAAATQAGVGFDPQSLGQLTSRYYVQDATTGAWRERDSAINFSVTNPLASSTAFESRWGAGSYTRKRWLGPDNELTPTVEQAMIWAFQNRPELLGVSATGGWTGQPTQIEVLDACATGYGTSIVVAYAQATWPGGSSDRRETVIDPTRPQGDFEVRSTYWPLTLYYHNRFIRYLPISPQTALLEDEN